MLILIFSKNQLHLIFRKNSWLLEFVKVFQLAFGIFFQGFSWLLGLLGFSVSLCDCSGFSVGFWDYSGFQLAFCYFQGFSVGFWDYSGYSVGFLDLFRFFSWHLGLFVLSVGFGVFSGFSVGFCDFSGSQLAFGFVQVFQLAFRIVRVFSWHFGFFGLFRDISEPICDFCLFDLISCLRSKMDKTRQAVDLEHRMRAHCNRLISLFHVMHFNLSYYLRSRIR